MITFYGLLLVAAAIFIGCHRVGNALDGLTQVLKED